MEEGMTKNLQWQKSPNPISVLLVVGLWLVKHLEIRVDGEFYQHM